MPKNKLKPVILSMHEDGGVHDERFIEWSGYVPCLCIPLTPESRKLMVEVLRSGITEAYCQSVSGDTMQSLAEAALAALEAIAKQP